MFKNKKIIIILIIVLIIILGVIFGIIDYNRVQEHMTPMFCINILDRPHSNETCWGIGYKIQKELDIPSSQPIRRLNSQKFGLWIDKKELYRDIDYDDYSGDYLFTIKEKKNCSYSKRLYYTDKDRKYYLYCLEDVLINYKDESIGLKDALKNNSITIENIMKGLTNDGVWYDGGTSIHKDYDKEYSKYGFAVLECKTLAGNGDIYIGPMYMSYEDGFCK